MSAVKISSIVHIFLEDPYFVSNWTQLAYSLNIHSSVIESLRRQLNCGSTTEFEILRSVLSTWKSRNGETATVESLCDSLQKLGFTDIKGSFKI